MLEGIWNYFQAQQKDLTDIDLIKEPLYLPNNDAHIKYIERKIKKFNEAYDAIANDIKLGIAANAAYFFIGKHLPFVSSLTYYADIAFSLYVGLQYLRLHPVQSAALQELVDVLKWMAKDHDPSITNDPRFLAITKAIAPLVPLKDILFWDLTVKDSGVAEINKEYVATLMLPPHRLLPTEIFKKEAAETIDQSKIKAALYDNSSLLLANGKYFLFGKGGENLVSKAEKVKDLAEKGYKTVRGFAK